MTLNSKLYDILKPVAMIYLPALATLYFAVATIWGIPDTTAVIGTITAVTTFLGSALHLSSRTYSSNGDGIIAVDENGLKKLIVPGLTAADIAAKKTITLKVDSSTSVPVEPPVS